MDTEKATEARERGNAFYKNGKLAEAAIAYRVAASLAPDDPAPFSNLSAVEFEMGHYQEAIELAEKSIALTPSSDQTRLDRFHVRIAKSNLHLLKTVEALSAAEKVTADDIREPLMADIRTVKELIGSSPDQSVARKNILDRLPRYKPCLYDEPEYFAVGHDKARSLLDSTIEQKSPADNDLSFLFCGIGDARNLFATITKAAGVLEFPDKHRSCFKSVHFTILDLKPAILAKAVLIFELLEEHNAIGREEKPDVGQKHLVLVTLAYVYLCQVYPPSVDEKVQSVLARLINRLEDGTQAVLKWLYLPSPTRAAVLRVLRQWHGPAGSLHRSKETRNVIRQFGRSVGMPRFGGSDRDTEFFDQFVIIPPPKQSPIPIDSELQALLDSTTASLDSSARKKVEDHLDRNWKTNVTLIDMDYEAQMNEEEPKPEEPHFVPILDFDPCETIDQMFPTQVSSTGIIDRLSKSFHILSRCLEALVSRSCVALEVVYGEMTDFMERLRYDSLEDRSMEEQVRKGAVPDPSTFPKQFDRIHLSNIPDYIGGLLAPALYCTPLLKGGSPGGANVLFNVQVNPDQLTSQDKLQAEYLLLPSASLTTNHFGLSCHRRNRQSSFMPDTDPYIWELQQSFSGQLPWDKLLRRNQVEKWLYSFLLKVCLPYPQTSEGLARSPVFSPLNLTSFLRLVTRLAELGYPAHWLSGVVSNICNGTITTTARAPRSLVLGPKDVEEVYPSRTMCVAPWKAEFTTLLNLWRPLLPFGFTVPKDAALSANDICKCSIAFPKPYSSSHVQPHTMIMFWDMSQGELIDGSRFRGMLLDDEVGDSSSSAKLARSQGLHVVTTFKYVTKTRTASFWLRKDVVDLLVGRSGNWRAYLWRSDGWLRLNNGVPAASGLVIGERWTGE